MRYPRIRRRAFTLLELLVVIAIFGTVVGLLLPAVHRVRQSAARTECKNNLHQIGVAITVYVNRKGSFPSAAQMPSLSPGEPSLAGLLSGDVQNRKVFHCPNDPTYFAQQGTSYEYPSVRLAGRSFTDLARTPQGLSGTWVSYDYQPFHGISGEPTSHNYLYVDGHVE